MTAILHSFAELAATKNIKITQRKMKPKTPGEELEALGTNAQKVWTFLQARQAAILAECVAIGRTPAHIRIDEIAKGTNMGIGVVVGAVVALAQNGFIAKVDSLGVVA